MRQLFVAGNWKMNLNGQQGVELAKAVKHDFGDLEAVRLAVCPPFVYLSAVAGVLAGSAIGLGAQNMHPEPEGAFTGEVAGPMLLDVGCRYVILGHSERRHVMGESDEFINAKVLRALDFGLEPILCLGETLEEREAERTVAVVAAQLRAGLEGVSAEQMARVTVAYEPVWAIGTGRTATPDQAEEVHVTLRALLAESYGGDVAGATVIQYGGSVKPDNAAELMGMPNVDGALVGGASLKADAFGQIIQAACHVQGPAEEG
jgi:triosephosphate isomerase